MVLPDVETLVWFAANVNGSSDNDHFFKCNVHKIDCAEFMDIDQWYVCNEL